MIDTRSPRIHALFTVAAVGIVVLYFEANPVLRLLFAAPLIFFLPGHAVMAAALPSAPRGLDRIVFSAGLSLAIVVLGGLALNLVSALTREGWYLFLMAVTSAGYSLAFWKQGAETGGTPELPTSTWQLSVKDVAVYGAALALVVSALAITTLLGQKYQQAEFTEFWIKPERTTEIGTAEIGMRNAEGNTNSYDIELMLGGQTIGAWRNISLKNNESWRRTIDLPGASRDQRLEAWLFKSGDHKNVYRRVWLAARDPA